MTDKQKQIIELLNSGKSKLGTSNIVKVSRTYIYKLLKQYPDKFTIPKKYNFKRCADFQNLSINLSTRFNNFNPSTFMARILL